MSAPYQILLNHIVVYCVLIKSLESLAQATAQRCVTIWNITALCNNLEHLCFTW